MFPDPSRVNTFSQPTLVVGAASWLYTYCRAYQEHGSSLAFPCPMPKLSAAYTLTSSVHPLELLQAECRQFSMLLFKLQAIPLKYCASLGVELLLWVLQRHILPYSPSPYVALALRLHRLVVSEVNPWAFFKLVDKASYRLGLWLQFLFPRMRYLYLTRIVSASGGPSCHYICSCNMPRLLR